MLWVIVFAAIALAGLVMLACYAVWLAHKISDVWAEVGVLTERGAGLAELLGQIGPAAPPGTIDIRSSFPAGGPDREPLPDVR